MRDTHKPTISNHTNFFTISRLDHKTSQHMNKLSGERQKIIVFYSIFFILHSFVVSFVSFSTSSSLTRHKYSCACDNDTKIVKEKCEKALIKCLQVKEAIEKQNCIFAYVHKVHQIRIQDENKACSRRTNWTHSFYGRFQRFIQLCCRSCSLLQVAANNKLEYFAAIYLKRSSSASKKNRKSIFSTAACFVWNAKYCMVQCIARLRRGPTDQRRNITTLP